MRICNIVCVMFLLLSKFRRNKTFLSPKCVKGPTWVSMHKYMHSNYTPSIITLTLSQSMRDTIWSYGVQ